MMINSKFYSFKTFFFLITLILIFLFGYYLIKNIINKAKIANKNSIIEKCQKQKNKSAKILCWHNSLEKVIVNEGIPPAFFLLEKFYDSDKDFVGECHGFAHVLGSTAYKKFSKKEKFALPDSVSACNYGFYHGFMEQLAKKVENLKMARDFCEYVERDLGAEKPESSPQCYHGIGHGVTNIHDERKLWGNSQAVIDKGLGICKAVTVTWDQLYRCISGVYNALSDFYYSGEYGFKMSMINPQNPFYICSIQPAKYREACYGNMKSIIDAVTGKDFAKIAKIVAEIEDKEVANKTIWYRAGYHIKFNIFKKDFDYEIAICRSVKDYLRLPCIAGLATGFLWNAKSGIEYIPAFNFCRLNVLNLREKDACYEAVVPKLKSYYSKSKVKRICSSEKFPKKWKKYCQ